MRVLFDWNCCLAEPIELQVVLQDTVLKDQVGRALSRLCFATNRTVAFSTEESRLLSTVYKSRLVH